MIYAEIPPGFLERMHVLLGPEFPYFQECLSQAPTTGLRVNTLKIDPQTFRTIAPFELEPVPWCEDGFSLHHLDANTAGLPGKHPYHAAGVYYLQEPSGMAAVEILDPQPGERILDLAAAPGGKSTHIAAKMQNRGLLVANEVHPKRVWELSENLERWGAQNTAITNETPKRLAARWPEQFDRVLLDAPCSGEGMFRKSRSARQDWSIELVNGCALRQSGILEDASRMLRPGGVLVYSTCTFAPEENEGVIASFLEAHPDFELEVIPYTNGFSPGRNDWIAGNQLACLPLERTVRLWPHRAVGEGQYIARLRKAGGSGKYNAPRRKTQNAPVDAVRAYAEFCQNLGIEAYNTDELFLVKGRLYRMPAGLSDWDGLRMTHYGHWLGDIKRGEYNRQARFEPAHSLALALVPKAVSQRLNLELELAQSYLYGNPLPSPGGDSWVLMAIDGFSLGWGKRVNHVVKNLYPKGLRWISP